MLWLLLQKQKKKHPELSSPIFQLVKVPGLGLSKSFVFKNKRLKIAGTTLYVTYVTKGPAEQLKTLCAMPQSDDPGQLWSFNGRYLKNMAKKGVDTDQQDCCYLRFSEEKEAHISSGYLDGDSWLYDGSNFYSKDYSDAKGAPYRIRTTATEGKLGAWMEAVDPVNKPGAVLIPE